MTIEKSNVATDKKEAGEKVGKEAKIKDYFADFDFDSLKIDMESMLKAGVHFGHRKSRRHPKMDKYIHSVRKDINIINLQKTLEELEKSLKFITQLKKEGKKILFVGTKKQAQGLVRSAAERSEMPFVIERWLGGTFTNFKVIRGRAKYLKESQEKMQKGEYNKYTKFEQAKKSEELERLEKKMGGIKEMTELPGAIFVVDVKDDAIAVAEAKSSNIPVIALADTNTDPSKIEYPIPSNDDAISSLRLMLGYVCKTLLEK